MASDDLCFWLRRLRWRNTCCLGSPLKAAKRLKGIDTSPAAFGQQATETIIARSGRSALAAGPGPQAAVVSGLAERMQYGGRSA